MKTCAIRNPLLLAVLLTSATAIAIPNLAKAGEETKPTRRNIYDESADASKQIADALTLAKKEHKHVLLQFGANWCGWCHRLHQLCDSDKDIRGRLKSDYIVVLIDVNKNHNADIDTRYGHPVRLGLPALVVLDSNGKQLTTKDSGELEQGDHHDPHKVLSFLNEWAGESPAKR